MQATEGSLVSDSDPPVSHRYQGMGRVLEEGDIWEMEGYIL